MALPRRRTSKAGKERSGLSTAERRDWPAHRAWVRGHECCVCEAYGMLTNRGRIEAAHVRLGTDGGTSLKPHDMWVISLCSYHHEIQHQYGEASFALYFQRAFPKGLKARALEFAEKSPVAEVRERAKEPQA